MNKILLTHFFISILFISRSFAQQTGEKKGWPSAERYTFISECITSAKEAMSVDSARFYCYCMQEKIEAKYPTTDEAAKISEADIQSPEWQKVVKSCLNGFWTTSDREIFLSSCIESVQKGGLSEEKSKSYCECMLFKIEIRFPKAADSESLTPEKLNSPEWKKIVQGCLEF